MHQAQDIGLLILAIVVAWLLFKVIKKIVVAILVVIVLGAIALYVYLKFF